MGHDVRGHVRPVGESLRESGGRVHAWATAAAGGAASLLARLARHPRVILVLLVVALGANGLAGIPPVDRDEPQFTQPARQMLASGDFIDIDFQGAPLAQKPIMTYWLQAASAALFGGALHARIWAYRLPSVLGILLATLLAFELAAVLFGGRAAMPAALLVATSVLVQSQAHQARADALLLAGMMLVTYPLARAWLAAGDIPVPRERALAALFWSGMAFSTLTKGPVVPALMVLAATVLSRRRRSVRWLRSLHPAWGLPLFLLLLLPWPLTVIWLRGPALFVHAWQTDIYPKMLSGQESHGAPPLSYLVASPLLLWPATALLPAALELAWRRRGEAPVEFCWGTVLPGWMLFEAAPTKLPHYIMPFVPLLASLMAASVIRWCGWTPSRVALRLGSVLFAVSGAVVIAVVLLALEYLGPGVHAQAILWVLALLGAVGFAAAAAWRERLSRTVAAACLCGALASLTVFGFTMPRLERLWVADRAARAARAAVPAPAPAVVVGYDEPSLVFLLGERTRFEGPAQAASALEAGSAAVAIVAAHSAPAFLRAAARGRLRLRLRASVHGIDPVHGRAVALEVWADQG